MDENPMKKLLLLAIIATLGSGCATTTIKSEAFGKKTRYAVVSIVGATDITDVDGDKRSSSLVGMISAVASSDINFSEDSGKMFNDTRKIIDEEFKKAKSFKYVNSKALLKSRAYKNAKGEEPKVAIFKIGLAPGYKYFNTDNMNEIKKIIKGNKLDGAIIINASYNYGTGGVNVGGLVSVGKTRGYTTLQISAIDKDLKTVWSQSIRKESAEGIGNFGGAPSFKKLYPLLKESTRSAVKEAVTTLDSTVYAKK